MAELLLHVIVSPLVRLWLKNSSESWRLLPRPTDRLAHSPGANADKILLVGGGLAAGYGVRTAGLALGGHLARQLTMLTGRGASVHTVAELGMRVSGCATAIESFDLSSFDALVITLGADEALNLVPVRRFRHDLDALLTWVDTHAPSSLSVVFVGIPSIPSVSRLPRIFRPLVDRSSVRLDEQLRRACAEHTGATYVPFHPDAADFLYDSGSLLYSMWAGLLAPTVARVLDAQLSNPRSPSAIDEPARQVALDELGILDTAREERFDRIVASARDLFGVAGASLTFIDCDRQWTKASIGLDPTDGPRGHALGDATVNSGKILVVTDASVDRRFREYSWVAGHSQVRFFAGFPIEAANGQRIGALCIMDSKPRAFSPAESSLLGQLAMQVQADLWGSGH
jgi:hypothetical protein